MSKPCEKIHPVKRNDTGAAFEDHLMLNGESVDLAGGSVKAWMRSKDGTALIENGTVSILQTGDDQDRTEPNVRFTPESADLDVVGVHNFEWRVVLAGGGVLRFPRKGYHRIHVQENLDDPSDA